MIKRLRRLFGMLPKNCAYLPYFHGYILMHKRDQTDHFAYKKKELREIAWKSYG